MDFQFIDSSRVDAATRRNIRSRVMLGRNAGKQRSRKNARSKAFENTEVKKLVEIVPRVGNDYSLLRFPRPLDPGMRELIHRFLEGSTSILYPKDLCIPMKDSITGMFELFQGDKAFFSSILAASQAYTEQLSGLKGESAKTIRYLSETYQHINENLQNQETPSYGTVAAVMSVAMHDNLKLTPRNATMHLNALQMMVEMRGGIETFTLYPTLLHKICRTDIEYALQLGFRPRFHRDRFPRQSLPSAPKWLEINDILSDPEIKSVFNDLVGVSRFINRYYQEPNHPKLDPYHFQEVLISACYRLLHSYPLAEAKADNIRDNTCYLAILCLITTMFIRRHDLTAYQLLAGRLRAAIYGMVEASATDNFAFVWVLFTGSISVLESVDQEWVSPLLKESLSVLKIEDWETVRAGLETFPWIRHFHEKASEKLWEALKGS